MHTNFIFQFSATIQQKTVWAPYYFLNINIKYIPSQDTMNKNKEMIWVIPRISLARNRTFVSGGTHSLRSKALVSLSTVCTCQSSSASLNESLLFILASLLIWSLIHYPIWIIRLVVTRLGLVPAHKNDWQIKKTEKASQGGHNCKKVLLNTQHSHHPRVSGALYAQNPKLLDHSTGFPSIHGA
jgi:hypothetical protein